MTLQILQAVLLILNGQQRASVCCECAAAVTSRQATHLCMWRLLSFWAPSGCSL